MKNVIGIRYESKDLTEHRAPFTPDQVHRIVHEFNIRVLIEPSETRVFKNQEYRDAGAGITEDLGDCNIIFGIKEIPLKHLAPGQSYSFFSHTIKGQVHNMPMLKKLLELGNTLLDYELVKNSEDQRLIFFGNFAGYAGMIDTLWIFGQRLQWEGIDTPFNQVRPAHRYHSLAEAESAIEQVGELIREQGLPEAVCPLICGFTGYGQVSRAAQQIYDHLPVVELTTTELAEFFERKVFSNKVVYKVEFHEKDMFELKSSAATHNVFELQDYFDHPERYRGKFEQYVPYLNIIVNGIYWEPRYPRLVTKTYLKKLYQAERPPRLRLIGDITCDIDGSIEMNVKATNADSPVYVFDPFTYQVHDGWEGNGPVIMAVDKLPAELPREASEFFGSALLPFIPTLAAADFHVPFEKLSLAPELQKAVIVYQGKLTPAFEYLRKYLSVAEKTI